MAITIRHASAEDIPAVMKIVAHTIQGMKAMGNDQWDENYPKEDRFLTDIENGALFVANQEGKVIAFVTIDEDQADEYAALQWTHTNPLVMHRLAVHPIAQGSGVAGLLDEFTCQLAKDARKDSIRLDTHSTNISMQGFAMSRGYHKVGEMDYHGKSRPFFCYEKAVR